MGEQKHDDPKDRVEHSGGARMVPGHGMGFAVPAPITAGAPKPEPEGERWTLGPGRNEERPSEGDDRPDAAPSAGPNPPTTPRRPG